MITLQNTHLSELNFHSQSNSKNSGIFTGQFSELLLPIYAMKEPILRAILEATPCISGRLIRGAQTVGALILFG